MKYTIIGLIIEWHETIGYSLINLSRVESSTLGLEMFARADEEIKHKYEIKRFINVMVMGAPCFPWLVEMVMGAPCFP